MPNSFWSFAQEIEDFKDFPYIDCMHLKNGYKKDDLKSGFSYFVYIIGEKKDGEWTGKVKIGISEDVRKRIKAIQSCCPTELQIFGTFQVKDKTTAQRFELRLHKRFKKYHIHGEWFDLVNEEIWHQGEPLSISFVPEGKKRSVLIKFASVQFTKEMCAEKRIKMIQKEFTLMNSDRAPKDLKLMYAHLD